MDFSYTDEQRALQDTLGRFIEKDYDFDKRRKIAKSEAGFSREVWRQLAELGLLGLPFPEAYGGVGGGPVDTMIVMELMGRGLVLEPYLSSAVIAGGLIRDAGSEAQKSTLLPAIAEGTLQMSLAHLERGGRYDLAHVTTTAKADAGGYVINGSKGVVLNGASANKLIVSARTSGAATDAAGISLFIVDKGAPGLSVRGYQTQDGGRAAEVDLKNVKVGAEARIGAEGQALAVIERAVDIANAALCAEAVGIMTATNETTLDYIKTRKQFGQPIGKFQAIQHRMADMIVATEQAKSMSILANVNAGSTNAAERGRAIAGAKAYICQAARFVGQQAVQLHGGMGVTDEMKVSHYFKRLTMINATYGDADYHQARYSDTLLVA